MPAYSLAYETSRKGGSFPAVLNAANEEAVKMYLSGNLKFTAIPKLISSVLSSHRAAKRCSLGDIMNADCWAREETKRVTGGHRW